MRSLWPNAIGYLAIISGFFDGKKSKAPEILRGFAFAKALFLKVVVICPNVGFKAGVPENFGNLYTLQKLVVFYPAI